MSDFIKCDNTFLNLKFIKSIILSTEKDYQITVASTQFFSKDTIIQCKKIEPASLKAPVQEYEPLFTINFK